MIDFLKILGMNFLKVIWAIFLIIFIIVFGSIFLFWPIAVFTDRPESPLGVAAMIVWLVSIVIVCESYKQYKEKKAYGDFNRKRL